MFGSSARVMTHNIIFERERDHPVGGPFGVAAHADPLYANP
jgi:hypothetical protein